MADWFIRQCQINEIQPNIAFLRQLQTQEEVIVIENIRGSQLSLAFQAISRISVRGLILRRVDVDANMFRLCFERGRACSLVRFEECNLQLAPQALVDIFACLPQGLKELEIESVCTDNLIGALVKAAPSSMHTIAITKGNFSYRAIKNLASFCTERKSVYLSLSQCAINQEAAMLLINAAKSGPDVFKNLFLSDNGLPAEIVQECAKINETHKPDESKAELESSSTPEELQVKPLRKPQKKPVQEMPAKVNNEQPSEALNLQSIVTEEHISTVKQPTSCVELISIYKETMSRSIEENRQLNHKEFEEMRQMFLNLLDFEENREAEIMAEIERKLADAEEIDELARNLNDESTQIWEQFCNESFERSDKLCAEIHSFKDIVRIQNFRTATVADLEKKQTELREKESHLRAERNRNEELKDREEQVRKGLSQEQDSIRMLESGSLEQSSSEMSDLEAEQYRLLKHKVAEIYPQIEYLREQLEEIVKSAE